MNSGKADITRMSGMRVWTRWLVKTLSNTKGKVSELEKRVSQ